MQLLNFNHLKKSQYAVLDLIKKMETISTFLAILCQLSIHILCLLYIMLAFSKIRYERKFNNAIKIQVERKNIHLLART